MNKKCFYFGSSILKKNGSRNNKQAYYKYQPTSLQRLKSDFTLQLSMGITAKYSM